MRQHCRSRRATASLSELVPCNREGDYLEEGVQALNNVTARQETTRLNDWSVPNRQSLSRDRGM